MKKVKSVEEFFSNLEAWHSELSVLRSVLLSTELKEEVKWGIPTYVLNGKNVVAFSGFKNHFALWFFNGSFLTDKAKVLVNAQEGKTKGLRQWRFTAEADIDREALLVYILEAIENQKQGKEIKPDKKMSVVIPDELKEAIASDEELFESFDALTKGRQKEYCNYITEAKREATKVKRLQKIIPMIKNGVGLNDKYKKS